MKYLGILKDSLLETIDSKVFFVVGVISLLAICLMATVTLEPIPSNEGFQRITDRFPDGATEVDLPIVGKMKATPAFTQYSVQDVKGPENNSRPWDAEYQFVIESRDLEPLGGRSAILLYTLQVEEDRERREKTGRKTRARQLQEDISEEVRRIREQEEKKGKSRFEADQDMRERLTPFIVSRLEREARSLTDAELESFVRDQMEQQGNWRVTEVKFLDLPPSEKNIKLTAKVLVKEGDDIRIKTEERPGEINKFQVKVTPRGATYLGWPHKASLLFGGIPLGSSVLPGAIVSKISSYAVARLGAPGIMLLSCIITSFYIPNMLRKGTIDLLLSKPVSRTGLLLYKYIGGLTFMVINTALLILGLWFVLGLRTSIWELAFLWSIPILTFEFALFYALSTLAAVLTRSPVVCILGCVLMWALLSGVGWAYWLTTEISDAQGKEGRGWFTSTMEVAHAALPHYLDLDWLGDKSLREQTLPEAERPRLEREYRMFNWSESILVTAAYIVLLLGLGCWRFSTKDY
jgi:ABC-type transport system involved in multi-copper enzyme maturation permease subunit